MRTKLFTAFLLSFILGTEVKAQNNKLHLYASFGAEKLTAQQLHYSADITPTLASTIGAGSLFQKKNLLFGNEFYYSKGSKEMNALQTNYSSMNTNFFVGYQLLNKSLNLSLLAGFGYSLNHIVVTDMGRNNTGLYNSAMFHNNSYNIPVSILLQKVKPNGTFWGIKTGYNINVSRNNKWEFREKDGQHHYAAKSGGYYAQLILGGLLKL